MSLINIDFAYFLKLNTIYTLKTNNLREYESKYDVRKISKNLRSFYKRP